MATSEETGGGSDEQRPQSVAPRIGSAHIRHDPSLVSRVASIKHVSHSSSPARLQCTHVAGNSEFVPVETTCRNISEILILIPTPVAREDRKMET